MSATSMFGFTNKKTDYESVIEWRKAAIADGWEAKPTYKSESIERACSLTKDGFTAQIISREQNGIKWKYEAKIHVWGPDRLSVNPRNIYLSGWFEEALRFCPKCGAKDVETVRYSFAGRCCIDCVTGMKEKHEQPGWCD